MLTLQFVLLIETCGENSHSGLFQDEINFLIYHTNILHSPIYL